MGNEQIMTVACQGTEGAYSQLAAAFLFPDAAFVYFKNFEAVAKAVKAGLCSRGVLPVENNTWGSVREVYKILGKGDVSIVGGCRLKITHELMAKPGARMKDITAVLSHEQAIGQCASFLSSLGDGVRQVPCLNTAVAARTVSESEETGLAAIASPECASLYGLSVLKRNIADSEHNYTRFAAIGAEPFVSPDADRLSVILTVSHEPGSLAKVLDLFAEKGLNLLKIESVIIPGRDFEFMFYLDVEGNIHEPGVSEVLSRLKGSCPSYRLLGNYHEGICGSF